MKDSRSASALNPPAQSKKSEYQRPSIVTSVLLGKLARAKTERDARTRGPYHSSTTWPPVSCRRASGRVSARSVHSSFVSWAAARAGAHAAESRSATALIFIPPIYDSPPRVSSRECTKQPLQSSRLFLASEAEGEAAPDDPAVGVEGLADEGPPAFQTDRDPAVHDRPEHERQIQPQPDPGAVGQVRLAEAADVRHLPAHVAEDETAQVLEDEPF